MTQSPQPTPDATRGSLILGFSLGWASIIGGGMLAWLLLLVSNSMPFGGGNSLIGIFAVTSLWLPVLAPIALAVGLAIKHRSRSALGVVLAIVSAAALLLLLVAACFGMLVTMH